MAGAAHTAKQMPRCNPEQLICFDLGESDISRAVVLVRAARRAVFNGITSRDLAVE